MPSVREHEQGWRENIFAKFDWLSEMIDDIELELMDIGNPSPLVQRTNEMAKEDAKHAQKLRTVLTYLECQADELLRQLPEVRLAETLEDAT